MFEIKFRLREHPFYKAWENGEITIQKLSEYAYYWQRILNEFSISDKLNNMNSSQLLGAIHSFEVQQPEIAKFKKECLIKFYNFKEDDLIYFDEHMKNEFYYGFEKGQELFYRSLDRFI